MFKAKFVLAALVAIAFSAFAHASVNTATVEAQYELSQAPVDLGVQSDNVISFELTTAHSEAALKVEYGEVIKLERSHTEQFLLVDSQSDQLVIFNEVGWRS
jgi:methionine-rich copper-binding protein CopC